MNQTELQHHIREVINDPKLNYRQRMHHLAIIAENLLEYPEVSSEAQRAMDEKIICDLCEGAAPHRPRYILPDYGKALQQGSSFLELPPPENLDNALSFLLILYNHVPSITGFPVYLGDLDKILQPYIHTLSDEALYQKFKRFWISVDRMLPDAFVHTNIGPQETRLGHIILKLERELKQVVPNISLKVDPRITPDAFILEGIKTVFEVGKPHFINHPMMVGDLGNDYAAVSCYNSLKIGGGSHTLVRLNLKRVAEVHQGDINTFLNQTLPHYVELNLQVMAARIRYLVEEAKFFEHSFLSVENLIDLNQFSAMFGIVGMAEAVNLLIGKGKYGHDEVANQLSYQITDTIADLIHHRPLPYCEGNQGKAFFHAQSGMDFDTDVTAGVRIPIGEEPETFEHVMAVAPHHIKFNSGISDIFHFDDTFKENPQAIKDIIRGAFQKGMRDFTFNLSNNGFVRITGYLVRRSDVDLLKKEGSRYNSTVFGSNAIKNQGILNRVNKR